MRFRAASTIHGAAQAAQRSALGKQRLLCGGDGHLFKAHPVARFELGEDAEVRGDNIGDLRVAASGLAVGQHDDRLARRGHLNRAEGNAIGDDVAILDVFDQLAVKAALLGIVAVCAQYGRLEGRPVRPGADYRARQLREIVGYLGEHFTEPLSLTEVASHFGLSPQYFSTFFRENFGRTFTQHINSLRIEQAARLLRETDLPVMEVGFSVGFDNFSYFIKRFRSVYGVSPSHYRKG